MTLIVSLHSSRGRSARCGHRCGPALGQRRRPSISASFIRGCRQGSAHGATRGIPPATSSPRGEGKMIVNANKRENIMQVTRRTLTFGTVAALAAPAIVIPGRSAHAAEFNFKIGIVMPKDHITFRYSTRPPPKWPRVERPHSAADLPVGPIGRQPRMLHGGS